MSINTEFLVRCIQTLETAFEQLQQQETDSIAYAICRAACVKEFEIILEQRGNLPSGVCVPTLLLTAKQTA